MKQFPKYSDNPRPNVGVKYITIFDKGSEKELTRWFSLLPPGTVIYDLIGDGFIQRISGSYTYQTLLLVAHPSWLQDAEITKYTPSVNDVLAHHLVRCKAFQKRRTKLVKVKGSELRRHWCEGTLDELVANLLEKLPQGTTFDVFGDGMFIMQGVQTSTSYGDFYQLKACNFEWDEVRGGEPFPTY